MKKKVTSGIIFHDGNKFFAVKPTGFDRWEIPKGCVNDKEDHLNAALRELQEETGIFGINTTKILDMGVRHYNNEKDIHLFIYYGNIDFIKLEDCFCSSKFTDKNGEEKSEICEYTFIPYNKGYKKNFHGAMLRVLSDIFEETNL